MPYCSQRCIPSCKPAHRNPALTPGPAAFGQAAARREQLSRSLPVRVLVRDRFGPARSCTDMWVLVTHRTLQTKASESLLRALGPTTFPETDPRCVHCRYTCCATASGSYQCWETVLIPAPASVGGCPNLIELLARFSAFARREWSTLLHKALAAVATLGFFASLAPLTVSTSTRSVLCA